MKRCRCVDVVNAVSSLPGQRLGAGAVRFSDQEHAGLFDATTTAALLSAGLK